MTSAAAQLYGSREDAAAILGVSLGGLSLSMARGELDGLFVRVGRSVRFCLPALTLRAAGIGDAAALGAFASAAGIRDLAGLLTFLNGDTA